MRRLIVFFLLLTPCLYGSRWLMDHPGRISISWMGYRIETYTSLFALACLFAFVLLWSMIALIRFIWNLPSRQRHKRHRKQQEKGVHALSQALLCLAAHDTKAAHKALGKAETLLPSMAAMPLLRAQLAHQEGKEDQVQRQLEQLSDHQETAFLGHAAMLRSAMRRKDYGAAASTGTKAFDGNPKQPAIAKLTLEALLRHEDWAGAETLIRKATKSRAFDKDQAREFLAMLHTHRAQAAHLRGEFERSEEYVKLALKAKPHFLPAVIEDASVLADRGDKRALHRLLAAQWKYAPNPKLAEIYAHALEDSSAKKQERAFDKLIQSAPEHPESHVAAAKIAIATAQWERARNELKIALTKLQTARLYRLMADVEKGEHADSKAVEQWLARAVEAPLDEAFVCHACGHVHDEWAMFCTSCDHFNSVHWHLPGKIIQRETSDGLLGVV